MRAFGVFSAGYCILCLICSVNCGTVFKTILKPGTGPGIQANQTAVVHYTGTLQSGEKFDSSRDRGEPFEFVLGRGEVIPGWDAGVSTMKVGERAQLEIAPEDAYGAAGIPPTIPPSATLLFDIELLAIKDSSTNMQGAGASQNQPGIGATQDGISFSSIPQTDSSTSFQSGISGLETGPQATDLGFSQQPSNMGFSDGTQRDSMSQFMSGISPPGLPQPAIPSPGGNPGQLQPQRTGFSGSFDMSSQSQGVASQGSTAGLGMSIPNQGMGAVPSQGSSPDIVDLATQGQGFTVGNQDFSSQVLDLASQSQRMPSQIQSLPGAGRTQQAFSGRSSQNGGSSGQSLIMSAGQTTLRQPSMDTGNSQFQGMPGFVNSASGQSAFSAQNMFQNRASLGRDPTTVGSGFSQMSGQSSGSLAAGQPGILTPPGFSGNGIGSQGDVEALGRMFDSQSQMGNMVGRAQQIDGPGMFSSPSSRADRPRPMNSDQPSTQMQMLGRGGASFGGDRQQGQGGSGPTIPGMEFGMGPRGISDMGRGMLGRGSPDMARNVDGPGPDMGRTIGIGGLPDMRQRGMIDIMRGRGMPFMDPRQGMDPRFRGLPSGPPRFPSPPMPQRGMPPPALLQRLRMLQRLRGF